MAKTKATHNGTCQCCGAVQAVTPNGIAQHGYTVNYGFFNGVCSGSGYKPLEEDHTILDKQVATIRDMIDTRQENLNTLDRDTSKLMYSIRERGKSGYPEFVVYWLTQDDAKKKITKFSDYTVTEAFNRTQYALESQIRQLTGMAENLIALKSARFGQPLYAREEAVKPLGREEFGSYREAITFSKAKEEEGFSTTVRRQRNSNRHAVTWRNA